MRETLEALARMLAAANRNPAIQLDGRLFAHLGFEEAQQVQTLTGQLLSEDACVSKVAIDGGGRAIGAPIYGSFVVPSGGTVDLPPRGWLGIEVEIAARLSRTVTAELAAGGMEAVLGAIESFHVGIEIVGSRFADRFTAGPNGPFADNMTSAGYVWSPHEWAGGTEIDGLLIEVRVDGEVHWQGVARAPFGKLLDPIIAYAQKPLAFAALRGGMLVTTGTLCGLVELASLPHHVAAALSGGPAVEFNIRSNAD